MKKVLALTLAALAALALFAGCSKSKTDPGTIVVGASVTPHAEILCLLYTSPSPRDTR